MRTDTRRTTPLGELVVADSAADGAAPQESAADPPLRKPRRVAETLLGLGVLAFGVAVFLLPGPVSAVLLVIMLVGLALVATKLRYPVKTLLGRLRARALRLLGRPSPGGPGVRP